MTSPYKKQNKKKTKTKTKQKQNKQTNKNTFSLIFILPETIGIFISIDIDDNRRGFIPGSTQTWVGYTADFGHSGPRLAIASCGHSGNYTLRHWIRSHDKAQMAEASLRPVWQLPVWIRMAPHIGTCHSGHSWQLSLGPRVAVTWLFITFFTFYTKMRWLDGSREVPGVIPAPLLEIWYGDV